MEVYEQRNDIMMTYPHALLVVALSKCECGGRLALIYDTPREKTGELKCKKCGKSQGKFTKEEKKSGKRHKPSDSYTPV
jgi:hypothetical protein